MISQSEGDIPSDLRHFRYYVYEPTISGREQLQDAVRRVTQATMIDRSQEGTG
jgi:hypothetical protein